MLDDSKDATLAGRIRGVVSGGRPPDAARMLESLNAKLFQAERSMKVGRFEVRERLGAGGMGVVMSAFDPQLQRTVAVKLLRDGGNPDEQARLLEEARAMARLRHPNLVTVYEVGTHEGSVFIAMEFVEGGTLSRWFEAQPRDWREVVRVFIEAADGLAAIHDAGMVHRDFKPDNVLLGADGRAQVSDFGLARAQSPMPPSELEISADGDPHSSATDGIAGTPNYFAPEQWRGLRAHAASDQWSFCVALYEGLHGQRPFAGGSSADLCMAVLSGTRAPLSAEAPTVPRWLGELLERGLSSSPAERHASMHAIADALRVGLEERRRKTVRAAAGAAAVAATIVGAAVVLADEPAPCRDVDTSIREVWTPARRAALERRFSGLSDAGAATWRRIEPQLDTHVEQWAARRQDACEATHVRGEQSGDALDLRMRCLDRRALEIEALLASFEDVEVRGIPRALDSFEQLGELEVCDDLEFLAQSWPTPEAPELREAVLDLRERSEHISADIRAGKLTESEAAARGLVADAVAVGYEPAVAETKLVLAKVLAQLGQTPAAAAAYQDAFEHGLATHHLEVQVWAAVVSVFVHSELHDVEEARRWGRRAEALLRANDDFPQARRVLDSNLGSAALRAGDFDVARTHLDAALAMFRAAELGDSYNAIGVEANLGILARREGNLDEAAQRLEGVVSKAKRVLGDRHPMVGAMTNALAITYHGLGRLPEAEARYRESIEHLVAQLGEDAPSVAHPLSNLGEVLVAQGRFEEALPHLARAIKLWTDEMGPDFPLLTHPLVHRGTALWRLDRNDEAIEALERADALLGDEPDANRRAKAKLLLARVLRDADQLQRAAAVVDAALRLEVTDPEVAAPLRAWTDAP